MLSFLTFYYDVCRVARRALAIPILEVSGTFKNSAHAAAQRAQPCRSLPVAGKGPMQTR